MMKTTPKSSQSTVFQVESPDTLLNFLLEHVKNKSRNTVKGFLSKRQVKVGSKTVTAFDYALKPGQTVTILPPADQRAPKLPFPVIYEDADLIVIDKPAGLLTVATDRERDKTAYRILTDYLAGPGKEKPLFIVHRLDRDTSGVVLFAKNQEMKEALQEDWEDLVDRRVYLAAVEGRPPEERGTVKSFLRETSTHLVYSGAPGNGARVAVTHYEVLARGTGCTLLSVALDTGRKNQIRVHMQDLGCPVLGDKKYGGRAGDMGRLGLHARELAITDPRTGKQAVYTAPAPKEFRKLFPEALG